MTGKTYSLSKEDGTPSADAVDCAQNEASADSAHVAVGEEALQAASQGGTLEGDKQGTKGRKGKDGAAKEKPKMVSITEVVSR